MIDITIRKDGVLISSGIISYGRTMQHTTNEYWYEVCTFGKGKKIQSGEIEHNSVDGDMILINKVMERIFK